MYYLFSLINDRYREARGEPWPGADGLCMAAFALYLLSGVMIPWRCIRQRRVSAAVPFRQLCFEAVSAERIIGIVY